VARHVKLSRPLKSLIHAVTAGITIASATSLASPLPASAQPSASAPTRATAGMDRCAPRSPDGSIRCVATTRKGAKLTSGRANGTYLNDMATGANNVHPNSVSTLCSQGFFNPTRFTSCSDEYWSMWEYVITNGVEEIIGEIDFEIQSSVVFGISDGLLDWTLDALIIVEDTFGTLAAGVSGGLGTGCGQRPSVCLTNGNDTEPITLVDGGTYSQEWEQSDNGNAVGVIANSTDYVTGSVGVVLDLASPDQPTGWLIDDANGNTLYGRCDNIIEPADCVDPYGPMFVKFDATATPLVGPVADHIYAAEAALPSHWGNPNYANSGLTRTMSDADESANRAIACPPGQTPAGQSCDEYPMATTKQGAAFSAVGDWSTAYVPVSANSSQGGTLNSFYALDHVLDIRTPSPAGFPTEDEFYVQAVRSDGSSSW
jgi:Deoxyribonuclease NucA/NucB